ncbi:alpha/beta hydrolase [Novosphingobium sp. EMRT-2]|nr:alpha/beta hydrolase [Novosphingobium sp. EMRT-2]
MTTTLFTASGVRLRCRGRQTGLLNWLFLPGGPGIGSESLEELASALDLPGAVWLVDLPGDGSNRKPPGAPADPYSVWPQVLVEAAMALPNVVFAGHSTGGMYLLATPQLEQHICGLVLLDSAPDAAWHARFVGMTQRNPLPAVEAATAVYEADRCDENIAAIAVASAPWNFTPSAIPAGQELLSRMPYNSAAVEWSDAHFDHTYRAAWWPRTLPVLVLAGAEDRIVWQGGWDSPSYRGANVSHASIPSAGHFPWIDNPDAVTEAFCTFAARMTKTAHDDARPPHPSGSSRLESP